MPRGRLFIGIETFSLSDIHYWLHKTSEQKFITHFWSENTILCVKISYRFGFQGFDYTQIS